MRQHVYIAPHCLANTLIPAAIELYHRETSGFLIGSNGAAAKRVRVVGAYPLLTDKKAPTFVEHGNLAAVARLQSFIGSSGVRLLGGFHTHPLGPNKLSKSDIGFIEDKVREHGLQEWLELVLAVKQRRYASRKRTGWQVRKLTNKLQLKVVPEPFTGYDITLSGYWLAPTKPRAAKSFDITNEATLWSSKRVGS